MSALVDRFLILKSQLKRVSGIIQHGEWDTHITLPREMVASGGHLGVRFGYLLKPWLATSRLHMVVHSVVLKRF